MGGWIDYNDTYESFETLVGSTVGYQIVVDGDVYLIGDINQNRGVCDCCAEFRSSMIVEKFRKLV